MSKKYASGGGADAQPGQLRINTQEWSELVASKGLRQGVIQHPCRYQEGESSKHSEQAGRSLRFFPEGGNGTYGGATRSELCSEGMLSC